jgi:hypothetical protein
VPEPPLLELLLLELEQPAASMKRRIGRIVRMAASYRASRTQGHQTSMRYGSLFHWTSALKRRGVRY